VRRLRYDPQLDVDDSITTESERVAFLKTVSQLMASRARIKLNMRRLYAADGHAVKELLKIASMLYQATKRSTKDDSTGPAEFQLSTKAFDVKQSRHLASEITTRGAALYDMLEAEHELKDLRQKAINRNLDSSEVRTYAGESTVSTERSYRRTQQPCTRSTRLV
jgi:clusterin-associated protein 1